MKVKPSTILLSLISSALLTLSVAAQADETINIPTMDDASVFANFNEKSPAVINYFSAASEESIIDFYKTTYGEVHKQERKRGRLTLYFAPDDLAVRVVISTQNNKRQVDVIVDYSKVKATPMLKPMSDNSNDNKPL